MNRNLWWGVIVLGVLLISAYGPALSGGFLWDDDQAILHNAGLGTLEGLAGFWIRPHTIPQGHYWPMVYTTFWVEHQLWGLNPLGYHVVNLALHFAATMLLWAVLRALALPGAWLAAALFGVHPVHVESVAWIVERKDVLSAVFYLAATWCYLRFDRNRSRVAYAAALASFILGMLSKSMVVSLPVALLLVLAWRHRRRPTRRDWAPLVPLMAAGAALAWFDVSLAQEKIIPSGLGIAERAALSLRIVAFYLQKLFVPHPLIAVYPKWTDLSLAGALPALAGLGALVLAAVWAARRFGSGVWLAAAYLVLTLAPLLGWLDFEYMTHSYVADRYLYLPSIAGVALAAAGIRRLVPARSRASWAVACLAVLLPLTVLSHLHSRRFHDTESLFTHTLAHNPESFIAHSNLADALLAKGDLAGAERHFSEAARLSPRYPPAHSGLGYLHGLAGRQEEAIAAYRRALAVDPDYEVALVNLGATLVQAGRADEAAEVLQRALRVTPQDAAVHANLALALEMSGRMPEALSAHRRALALDSRPPVRSAYASALLRAGRLAEAETEYRLLLGQLPRDVSVRMALARLAVARDDRSEAVEHLQEVLRLDPANTVARSALQRLRRAPDALR